MNMKDKYKVMIISRSPTQYSSYTIMHIKRQKKNIYKFIVDIRPEKEETHRVRITVSNNLIDFIGNINKDLADLAMAKILFNIVISTPNVKIVSNR